MSIFMHSVSHRPSRKAMTLVELLVVIGIITLLATLLLPTLNDYKTTQTRLKCRVNMRSIAQAANLSAVRSATQSYPAGSVGAPGTPAVPEVPDEPDKPGTPEIPGEPATPDDYTSVSPAVRTEMNMLGVPDEAMTCQSIGRQDWMFSDDITKPFKMGIIYWLGREDIIDPTDSDITLYQSRARRDRSYDPSSSTLVTCMAYDSQTPGSGDADTIPGSVMPHLGPDYAEYAYNRDPNPWQDDRDLPDGMAVGFRDGSADFVEFDRFTPIDQLHKVWYVGF